jgi:hypothetical protein
MTKSMDNSESFLFALVEPIDGNPASVGNGAVCGFQLDSAEALSTKHALTIDLGGVDEGGPAIRHGRFSAYGRDLDGNKLCLFE